MKILLIEDYIDLSETMKFQLEKEGFQTELCHDGEEGLYLLREQEHDLVILDRMLPGMDGVTVLKKARQAGVATPVIFLTALGELTDRVIGLDCGADDYLVKPFAYPELFARIRCLLRRPGRWNEENLLKIGDISFDPEINSLKCGKKECTLSKREGRLLEVFVRNPGQVLPRAVLLNKVWGLESDVEEGNLDNYIHFLRRRLRSVGSQTGLKTVRGVGYTLEVFHS